MTPNSSSRCVACRSVNTAHVADRSGFAIHRCADCTVMFVPRDGALQQVNYDDLYRADSEYDTLLRKAERLNSAQPIRLAKARMAALQRIAQIKPATLLELGCGIGLFLKAVEQLDCTPPVKTYGLDVSRNAINIAAEHLDLPLHCGEFTDDVFPGVAFDVICSWEVIEHVTDPIEFIDRQFARLNPGGHVFFSTPNYQSTWEWSSVDNDPRSAPPVHITFWNRPSIRRLLSDCGFIDVDIQPYSIPLNRAARLGGPLTRARVIVDATLRPRQRSTLLARARKPSS